MLSSQHKNKNMAIKSYRSQAEQLLEEYIFADSFVVFSSVTIGILACKMVYDLSRMISVSCFESYTNLSKSRQIEWNNRATSTVHALFISTVSMYFAFWSDLYSDNLLRGPITLRNSLFSTFTLGVSVGYFLSDIAMIIWFYPSLGTMEYVVHHFLSVVGVSYALLSGEAQLYTYMVLTSEATTPGINLRWYLDAVGMKKSGVYVINGVVIFLAWLAVRILLFVYLFYHEYLYYDQMKQMHTGGIVLVLVVPSVIGVMNLIWFWKIFKGLKKTLAKRH